METSLIIPSSLEDFLKNKDIVWDFENNLCLFPLYLFQKFHSKYCQQEEIKKEESSYYSRKSVYYEYKESLLPKDYSSWFIATTCWNHVSLFFQIGKNGYIPFSDGVEYGKGLISYIHLQVFSNKIKIAVNVETTFDFNVLFLNNKIAEEITKELENHGLSI